MKKEKVVNMKCPKCKGVMVYETFTNQDNLAWHYDGWRCLYCGDVIDPVIMANKKASKNNNLISNKQGKGIKRHLKAA